MRGFPEAIMTAAVELGQRPSGPENRADQLEQLRRQMAAVAGKVGAGRRGVVSAVPAAQAFEAALPVPPLLAG
ncbi:hypothetical protein DQP56_20085, partial [Mycolicibacter senuensis]